MLQSILKSQKSQHVLFFPYSLSTRVSALCSLTTSLAGIATGFSFPRAMAIKSASSRFTSSRFFQDCRGQHILSLSHFGLSRPALCVGSDAPTRQYTRGLRQVKSPRATPAHEQRNSGVRRRVKTGVRNRASQRGREPGGVLGLGDSEETSRGRIDRTAKPSAREHAERPSGACCRGRTRGKRSRRSERKTCGPRASRCRPTAGELAARGEQSQLCDPRVNDDPVMLEVELHAPFPHRGRADDSRLDKTRDDHEFI